MFQGRKNEITAKRETNTTKQNIYYSIYMNQSCIPDIARANQQANWCIYMQTEKKSDTKTANITKFRWGKKWSGQQVISPVSSLLYKGFPVAFRDWFCFLSPEQTWISDNNVGKREDESILCVYLSWSGSVAMDPSVEKVRVLLSFLLHRSSSEPCLVFSPPLAPSSWNMKGKSHFHCR